MEPGGAAARAAAGAFRAAMGRWPTGVSVVTTHHDGHDAGLTVNAFLSVALEPPLVLVSLGVDADTTPLVGASGRFAVSVLAADQRALSERFARAVPTEAKFAGIAVTRGIGGVPMLDGALVHLECRVVRSEPIADHRLFVGEVERVGPVREALPLIFYRSGYAEAGPDGRLRLRDGPGRGGEA